MISHRDAKAYADRHLSGRHALVDFVATGEIDAKTIGAIVGVICAKPARFDLAELHAYVTRRAFYNQVGPVEGWAEEAPQ